MKKSFFALLVLFTLLTLAVPTTTLAVVDPNTPASSDDTATITATDDTSAADSTISPNAELPSASPSPSVSPSASPEVSPGPTATPDSGTVDEDSFTSVPRSIVWTKFRRFFAWNPERRSELTLAITNALLLQAQEEQLAGETDKAQTTLEKFETESAYLETISATLASKTTNASVLEFLDSVVTDKTAQLMLLDEVMPQATNSVTTQLTQLRSKTLRSIVKILEKPNLSDTDRQAKLDKVISKYAEKEEKIDGKIARKIALKQELDDESDDETLESALDKQEDNTLDDAGQLTLAETEDLVENVEATESDNAIVVLEKLLTRVPEQAQPAIEAALNRRVEKELAKFEENPTELDSFLEGNSKSARMREAVLKRLQEKASPAMKTEIEDKKSEKTSSTSGSNSRSGSSSTQKASATPVASASPKASPSTSPTAGVKQTSLSIRLEDGAFKESSLTVEKNTQVTIEFENRDDASRTLILSNGTTKTLKPGAKATLPAFSITGPVTFSVTIDGKVVSGTISVR